MRTIFLGIFCSFCAGTTLAQDCKFTKAYGRVLDLESGLSVHATPETLPQLLLSIHDCVQARLPSNVQFVAVDNSQLAGLAIHEKLLVSLSDMPDENWIAEQLDVAWRLIDDAGISRSNLMNNVRGAGFGLDSQKLLRPHLVDPYIAECRDNAHVPVPGPIGGDDWSDEIDISEDKTLVFGDAESMSIWLHGIDETGTSTSDGFCVAFKRAFRDETLIGTICMNEARTKACFFDNKRYVAGLESTTRMTESATLQSEFNEFALVSDSERCQACHIGNNPLLLHPGTTLFEVFNRGKTIGANFEFVEFGEDNWCNPKPLSENGGCFTCHDIPEARRPIPGSKSFCSVLQLAANKTMPPKRQVHHSDIVLWPDENGDFPSDAEEFEDFFPSLRAIKNMCTSYGGMFGTCKSE